MYACREKQINSFKCLLVQQTNVVSNTLSIRIEYTLVPRCTNKENVSNLTGV